MNRINQLFLSLILATLIPISSYADTITDENLPVEITADTLKVKEAEGISIYTGTVKIIQGTTQILGDKVTLIHPLGQIKKIISIGNQTTFKRFLPEEQIWITGRANKITYFIAEKKVAFEGQAFIEQEGKSSIKGPYITYDLVNKTLSAKATEDKQERVKMIFYPVTKTP